MSDRERAQTDRGRDRSDRERAGSVEEGDRKRVTTKLEGGRLEYFWSVKSEEGIESNAEAMRAIVDRARSHGDARERAESLQARVEELEAELRAANQRIDTANELARYVEEEKELQQEQREWERRRRRAGLLTRAKWALFGTSEPVESEG